MKFRPATLVSLVMMGFAVGAAQAKDPPLLSLNMEHFRDTATVKFDSADAVTTVTTEDGYVEHTGLMRMVWNDEYLRGVIDKKSGQKSFQVYALIVYTGNPRSFATARYQAAAGTRSAPVTALSTGATGCAVGDCTYTARLAFPVDEELLRQLAAAYVPGSPTLWRFTIIAASGPAYAGQISNAEIAGFLAKVDAVAGALPISIENAANSSLKLDLGAVGIPVAGTQDQPNRAGILITAVNHGSVAQKSGIIIGDILFEFGGHAVKTPADLEAAVAACAANSAAVIKLYRGTDALALKAQF
ncbi:MAG: PDZ domain-containing protein [Steroidobacteraceae bacterium]